jgi:hypothetical protein
MEAICHPFFSLAGEREACIAFRKSLLMLANSLLVGTFFSSSRFCFASIQGPFADLEFYGDVQRCNEFSNPLEVVQKIVHQYVLRTPLRPKPSITAVRAGGSNHVKFPDWNVEPPPTLQTLEFKTTHITNLNDDTLLGSQFSSLVMP